MIALRLSRLASLPLVVAALSIPCCSAVRPARTTSVGDACSDDRPCSLGVCYEERCVVPSDRLCAATPDCDDGDPATREACKDGQCLYLPAESRAREEEASCAPMCGGRDCGSDGCGGSCGTCPEGRTCGLDSQCAPEEGGETTSAPTAPPGYGVTREGEDGPWVARPEEDAVAARLGEMVWLPAGQATRGRDDGPPAERPSHPVRFAQGYWIDRQPATAGAFAAFLRSRSGNDCGGTPCVDPLAPLAPLAWDATAGRPTVRQICQAAPGGESTTTCASHPVSEVTWHGAHTFCSANGKRLCSEAEWERAARGEGAGRVYPWGDDKPTAQRANCGEGLCGDGYARTAPVGRFPDGAAASGCFEMAGQVWEWVEDDWHASYDVDDRPDDGTAWRDEPRGHSRVLRGGSFESGTTDYLRTTRRFFAGPATSGATGVRCCAGAR